MQKRAFTLVNTNPVSAKISAVAYILVNSGILEILLINAPWDFCSALQLYLHFLL